MLNRVSSLHSTERLKQCVCSRGGCRLVSVSAFRLYAAVTIGVGFPMGGISFIFRSLATTQLFATWT